MSVPGGDECAALSPASGPETVTSDCQSTASVTSHGHQ